MGVRLVVRQGDHVQTMGAEMTERQVHASIYSYLSAVLPGSCYIHHSPNEGRRGWRAQADIKSQGVQPGHPDIEVIYDGCAYFLEVKRPAPSKTYLSPAQKAVHARLADAGAKVATVRSVEDTRAALADWRIPTKECGQ